MDLYLVRHGEAAQGSGDPGLSARGINASWRVAAFLRDRVKAAPDEVLSSTKLRAKETASILAEALTPGIPSREVRGMTPYDPVEDLAGQLLFETGSLVLVSHLPFLPRLASHLILGHENGSLLALPPAGVLGLVREGVNGGGDAPRAGFVLRFFVTPDVV